MVIHMSFIYYHHQHQLQINRFFFHAKKTTTTNCEPNEILAVYLAQNILQKKSLYIYKLFV